jgi:hypothetical protein
MENSESDGERWQKRTDTGTQAKPAWATYIRDASDRAWIWVAARSGIRQFAPHGFGVWAIHLEIVEIK